MNESKQMLVYGLKPVRKEKLDLRSCFIFFPPNRSMDDLFFNNRMLLDSPHVEICNMYVKKGIEYFKKHYIETRYWDMMKRMGKTGFPQKIINICDSVKTGYLRKGYEESQIVILMQPFAYTRYNRDVPKRVPEIWSGHHRSAALLAIGKLMVDVIVAEDVMPGSKYSVGKVHDLCKEL